MAARVLVAYATKLGATAEIAEAIAGTLREAGHDADARPAREAVDLDGVDAVVLGSALYAAHWQKDARRFVFRHRERLAAMPCWLFSSGPLDAALAAADLPMAPTVASLVRGLPIRRHRTFGGRLAPDAAVDPHILETHPVGDFRDWAAIRAWGLEIADELRAGPAGD
jgi:menaquinone-dependent protoporphyrinogen oxidase